MNKYSETDSVFLDGYIKGRNKEHNSIVNKEKSASYWGYKELQKEKRVRSSITNEILKDHLIGMIEKLEVCQVRSKGYSTFDEAIGLLVLKCLCILVRRKVNIDMLLNHLL